MYKVMSSITFLVLSLAIITGCTSFKPVATMSDSQLQHEYLDTQYQIRIKESELSRAPNYIPVSPPSSYSTTGYSRTYGNTTYIDARTTPNSGGFSQGFTKGWNMSEAMDVSSNRNDLKKLLSRQRELGMEMYRRGINNP